MKVYTTQFLTRSSIYIKGYIPCIIVFGDCIKICADSGYHLVDVLEYRPSISTNEYMSNSNEPGITIKQDSYVFYQKKE